MNTICLHVHFFYLKNVTLTKPNENTSQKETKERIEFFQNISIITLHKLKSNIMKIDETMKDYKTIVQLNNEIL